MFGIVQRHGGLLASSNKIVASTTTTTATVNAISNVLISSSSSSSTSKHHIKQRYPSSSLSIRRSLSTHTNATRLPAVLSPARKVIVKLLQNIGGKREVEQYLKFYASTDGAPKFAVIKVGGGLIDQQLDLLAESLTFLAEVGLTPVVIHGAGPQLNDTLRAKGIESDYIGGLRITTPEILATARTVFLKANAKLVDALEKNGTRARPIVSGVFESEQSANKELQLVGDITNVNIDLVMDSIHAGAVPVLTCMGESKSGQRLNINADVAAQELAKALKPVKIVYLSTNGGLRDDKDQLISTIDLETDYEPLMVQPWFKHGNRLKLKEIKTLLDALPISSTVSITSAEDLPRELFTQKGRGTLVRRSEKVFEYSSLDEIDRQRLTELIESSFEGHLVPGYLDSLRPNLHRIYLNESYRAMAIISKDKSDPNAVAYLDKFAVAPSLQSEGIGQSIWNILTRDYPQLFWRSRQNNPINPWYYERSSGCFVHAPWVIFWYGIKSFEQAQPLVQIASSYGPSIDRSKWVKPLPTKSSTSTTSTLNSTPTRSFSTFTRSFSTGTNTKKSKLGLIGARGHTGSELLNILANHKHIDVALVSSRAAIGKELREVVTSIPANVPWASLKFVDLAPADLGKHSEIDVWILALPNNLAAPYVKALDESKSKAKIVDLSADYRFDSSWAYGLPERKGNRSIIAASSRISNPGCYATGAQVSLLPLEGIVSQTSSPSIFGVSGYSGAGTTPSRKNDTNELHDNLMPYSLVNHMHEKEVSHQLKTVLPQGVHFMPHVASWFRGIALTINVPLAKQVTADDVYNITKQYYHNEKMIEVEKDIMEVKSIMNKPQVKVGGFVVHQNRLVITTVIDNLLKGAASQCIQNVNLSLGYDEYEGIL
jgi:N-acetyl-gamma-glutamyl-phosphate reductase/acetylglutamate kinase